MEKKINNNEHPYVDLDLPSGTLWSTMNVGASKASDAGLYFQWGDTKGYTKDQVGIEEGQKAFTWTDYKYSIKGTSTFFTKYENKGESLDLEDDAANVNMGGDWHMPTPKQIRELIDNTTSEWTEQDDVKGRLFISKKDKSKSIFISAVGGASDGLIYSDKNAGGFWSSKLSTDLVEGKRSGKSLYFRRDEPIMDYSWRYIGLPVRGVIDKK